MSKGPERWDPCLSRRNHRCGDRRREMRVSYRLKPHPRWGAQILFYRFYSTLTEKPLECLRQGRDMI